MGYPHTHGTINLTADHLTAKIRAPNDAFRQSFIGGQVIETPGAVELREADRIALLLSVRRFDRFDPNNDPHDEHDFGSLEIGGQWFSGKSMPTIMPCLAIRRIRLIQMRQCVCSPSCAPTSTEPGIAFSPSACD